MASRSTRDKIRYQSAEALAHATKAQKHLVQMAALADEQSPFINDNVPELVAALETVLEAMRALDERL